jgi:hypothetical protein
MQKIRWLMMHKTAINLANRSAVQSFTFSARQPDLRIL